MSHQKQFCAYSHIFCFISTVIPAISAICKAVESSTTSRTIRRIFASKIFERDEINNVMKIFSIDLFFK